LLELQFKQLKILNNVDYLNLPTIALNDLEKCSNREIGQSLCSRWKNV